MTPTPHRTDIVPTKAFGGRRYESRCRGELRRDLADAESDQEIHEALSQQAEGEAT